MNNIEKMNKTITKLNEWNEKELSDFIQDTKEIWDARISPRSYKLVISSEDTAQKATNAIDKELSSRGLDIESEEGQDALFELAEDKKQQVRTRALAQMLTNI